MKNWFDKLKNPFKKLIKECKDKKYEVLLLLFTCLMEMFFFSSLVSALNITLVATVITIFICINLSLYIILLIKKKPDREQIKKFLIFFALALLFGLIRSYLYIASLLIAYIFLDDRKMMFKWIFIICTVSLGVYVLLYMLTIIPDMIFIRVDDGLITNIRHGFGFNHPNHVMKFFLVMVISGYLTFCNNKIKTLLFTVIMFPLAILIGLNTHCRTGLTTMCFAFLIMNMPFLVSWIKAKWLYFIFIAITIGLIFSKYSTDVNDLLSLRPGLFWDFIKEYRQYMLFGKCYDLLLFNPNAHPLDNGYLYILFDGGILALITVCFLFFMAFKDNKDKKITVVLIVLLFYSLTEVLSIVYNNLLYVLMFANLLDKYIIHKEEKVMINYDEIKIQGDE